MVQNPAGEDLAVPGRRAFIPVLQVLMQTGCCGSYLQRQVSVRKVEAPG